MVWERKRILVWGKTYPELSKKYRETVCTGAIDATTGGLIRIYPLSLRYMKQKIPKYTWIEAEIQKSGGPDTRPESYKVNQTNIEVGETIEVNNQKRGYAERSKWILAPGNVYQSVEDLWEAQKRDGTSLGVVRIREVVKVKKRWKTDAERAEWDSARDAAASQGELFVDVREATKELVFCPVEYELHFRCFDAACTRVHQCSIRDWEIYQLDYKQSRDRGSSQAEDKVQERIITNLDPMKRDCYLFMGNTAAHRGNFMVVGFFHPPKAEPEKPGAQMGLFDR